MSKESGKDIRLGIFVIAGLALLITGLYLIGNNKSMFNKNFRLLTTFSDVNGLTAGSNVRYSGIDVGTVKKIEIKNDTTVYVEMMVNENLKNFIRKNSIARVGTDGLMGNKLVNIDAGTAGSPLVSDNDRIPSVNSVNTVAMLRTLEYTNENVAVISANLKSITDNIDKGRGALYTVLMDTTISSSFHNTLANIELVSQNLTQISVKLSVIVNDVNNGNGTIGTLLKDSTLSDDIQDIILSVKESGKQLSAATKEANELISSANKGNGTVSILLNDTAFAGNLKQTIGNIQTASVKLNEDLEGLKHSFLLRGYFRKKDKAKQKAADSKK